MYRLQYWRWEPLRVSLRSSSSMVYSRRVVLSLRSIHSVSSESRLVLLKRFKKRLILPLTYRPLLFGFLFKVSGATNVTKFIWRKIVASVKIPKLNLKLTSMTYQVCFLLG